VWGCCNSPDFLIGSRFLVRSGLEAVAWPDIGGTAE
jgi:hypothetical protein